MSRTCGASLPSSCTSFSTYRRPLCTRRMLSMMLQQVLARDAALNAPLWPPRSGAPRATTVLSCATAAWTLAMPTTKSCVRRMSWRLGILPATSRQARTQRPSLLVCLSAAIVIRTPMLRVQEDQRSGDLRQGPVPHLPGRRQRHAQLLPQVCQRYGVSSLLEDPGHGLMGEACSVPHVQKPHRIMPPSHLFIIKCTP
jgi:hypothetical protein